MGRRRRRRKHPKPELRQGYRVERIGGSFEVWNGMSFICALFVNKQNKWAATHNMIPESDHYIHETAQSAVDWYESGCRND